MLYKYFVQLLAPFFWLFVLGLAAFLSDWKNIQKKHLAYLAAYFLLSAILVLYYGSWKFNDNPDPEAYTIGNSYTRYWLPVYLGALPFAAFFIMRLTRALTDLLFRLPLFARAGSGRFLSAAISKQTVYWSMRWLVIGLIAFSSLNFLLLGSEEGLAFSLGRQRAARAEWEQISRLTESNSVLITRYHDKLFFPERKVIVGLFDDPNMIAEYANIAAYLPLYYYNFTFPEADLKYLNDRRLAEFGLGIELLRAVTADFSLYRIFPLEPALHLSAD